MTIPKHDADIKYADAQAVAQVYDDRLPARDDHVVAQQVFTPSIVVWWGGVNANYPWTVDLAHVGEDDERAISGALLSVCYSRCKQYRNECKGKFHGNPPDNCIKEALHPSEYTLSATCANGNSAAHKSHDNHFTRAADISYCQLTVHLYDELLQK